VVINNKFFGNKDAKIERVRKTIREMYQNGERLTVRKIIEQSGVCQRVVCKVLKNCPYYDPKKYKSNNLTT
jgi:hypothetical protein